MAAQVIVTLIYRLNWSQSGKMWEFKLPPQINTLHVDCPTLPSNIFLVSELPPEMVNITLMYICSAPQPQAPLLASVALKNHCLLIRRWPCSNSYESPPQNSHKHSCFTVQYHSHAHHAFARCRPGLQPASPSRCSWWYRTRSRWLPLAGVLSIGIPPNNLQNL